MNGEIIISVDIGTTKICVIVGKQNEHGKIEVFGKGTAKSEGVSDGRVINKTLTIASIREAVKKAEHESQMNIESVIIGIAGAHIGNYRDTAKITRDTEQGGDVFTEADVVRLTQEIEKRVMEPGIQILHVEPQRYFIDDMKIDISKTVGCVGMHLKGEFNIITVATKELKLLIDCINGAGLKMRECTLEPIASAEAVLSPEEREVGVALIDIGGGTTDMVIYKEGVIRHTHSFDCGGVKVTEGIKESCDLSMEKAEELKLKYGHAYAESAEKNKNIVVDKMPNGTVKTISQSELSRIIEHTMSTIIEVMYVQIVKSGFHGKLTGGIVVTGGGSLLKDVAPLFEYMTGQNVRLGNPNIHLTGNDNGTSKQLNSPIYSTAVGLLKSALTLPDVNEKNMHKKASWGYHVSQFFRKLAFPEEYNIK